MTARSDTKTEMVGNQPISARPSSGPGNMMMVGSDEDEADDDMLLFDDERISVKEVRKIVREELKRAFGID